MKQEQVKKILVRLPTKLTDLSEALPFLAALRDNFPKARITLLVKSEYKEIVKNLPADEIIGVFFKPRFSPTLENGEDLIRFLQGQQYDVGILLSFSFSSAYVFYLSLIARRIGFVRPLGSFMLTDRVPGNRFLSLLEPLGVTVSDDSYRLQLMEQKKRSNFLQVGVCCCLGDESQSNKWYKENLTFITEEIPYVKILVIKDGELKDVDPSITVSPRLESLAEEMERINSFDVFISDDEELLALAKGVGTPFVDARELVRNEQLLPEDFFSHVRDSILQPLKDRSSMRSIHDVVPITDSVGTERVGLISGRKVGVIILAGGMGRRLGSDRPKGLLEVGGRPLYDILLEKAKSADRIGILTSPVTFTETKAYCEGKNIDLFHKKAYPTEEGYGISPEGNGALFDALVHSEHWKDWKTLDVISVIAVDNPMANPLDEELLAIDKELVVIGVERDRKEEKLGVLCRKGDELGVAEYFTLSKEGMEGLGYSGSFSAKPSFFERVANEKLPFYRVEKKGQVFYERLLIDGFAYATSFAVLKKERKACFYPIKEKKDLYSYNKTLDVEGVTK